MSLTPEQLTMRRSGLSASDPAAIAGLHPSRNALDVFREKTEEDFTQEQSDAMLLGDLLEAPVAELYRHKTGATLETSTTLRHKRLPLMLATPDRIATIDGEKRLLEVKTSAAFGARDLWGPEGSDAIPEHHMCQVQWTMAVAALKRADVAALFSGREFAVFHVELDMAYVEQMYELALAFWEKHVLTRTPPPPDGSPQWSNWLKERLPVSKTTELLPATFEDVRLVNEYRAGQDLEEMGRARKALARQMLELRIEANAGLEGPGWRLWWKSNKPKLTVDWEALALTLGATKEQMEEHTRTGLGNRPFVIRDVKPRAHLLPDITEAAT